MLGQAIRTCKECGIEFTITESEQEFFLKRNLDLPTHCRRCRKFKKLERELEAEHGHPSVSKAD